MDKFTFGKYKDISIAEVAEENPHYVIWAYENVENPKHGGVAKRLYEDLMLDDYFADEYEDEPCISVDGWGN